MYVNCIWFLNIIFFSFITTVKAEILSYDIQVEEKNIAQKLIRVHDETGKWVAVEKKETHNLIEDMNVYELSSHARFLALPHMVTTYNYYNNKDTNINWEQIIKEAAHKYQINARLIWAVIRVESNFIATAISHKGAIGAMQIMPETQKELGLQNPINAKENVFAGTIIKNGSITVEAEKVGDERTVSRIIKLVEDANFNKADIQNYADNFSAQLIPLNFLLAGIVYGATRNIQKAMSMLVIDYSCGIRLSTATAFSAAINTAAKNGILIKGSNYIEELSKADTIIFDKTGTITKGKPSVQTINVLDKEIGENVMLAYAAAAEETSSHPLAVAILNEAKDRGIEIPKHSGDKVVVARGIETETDGAIIRVGNKKFMEENNIKINEYYDEVRTILSRGEILIYIAKDNALIGLLGVTDPPRENIKKTINRLRGQGIDEIVLLTGDLEQQAQTIATKMSIDSYESELLPEDKAKNILSLQSKGSKVIMIGDGINDAPALSYADIGVALGSTRTDVAMEAADVTIAKDDPLAVPEVIGLSKNTVKIIKENFAMAIGINSFALVLGATGMLPTIYSSIIHNLSTVLVVGNSLRLLKYRLKN